MRLYFFFLIAAAGIAFTSCKKSDHTEIGPERFELEIDGEGGEHTVELGAGNWQVVRVVNNDGNQRMFGDAYTLDGKIIRRSQPLELDGLGRMTVSLLRRELNIIHGRPGTIQLLLGENSSGRPFSFMVVLENGRDRKEIVVEQPKSAGYSFENIEYFLEEGDGDSVYVRDQLVTYNFDFFAPQDVEVYAFGGPNVMVNSHFESDDDYAFFWLTDEPVEVPVPAEIRDGRVFLSDEKRAYGNVFNEPYPSDARVTISAPAGQSKYANYIEERRRTVSYKLTITNNGTGERREVGRKMV